MAKTSKLETLFAAQLAEAGLPEPIRQFRFHPKRRWRADFAWPAWKLLIEVDGGTWMKAPDGRGVGHAHPTRYASDIDKLNAAALAGWTVLRCTDKHIADGSILSMAASILETPSDEDELLL